MEESYDYLIEILANSVKKNGEITLTNKHLLNILIMVEDKIEKDSYGPDIGDNPSW